MLFTMLTDKHHAVERRQPEPFGAGQRPSICEPRRPAGRRFFPQDAAKYNQRFANRPLDVKVLPFSMRLRVSWWQDGKSRSKRARLET